MGTDGDGKPDTETFESPAEALTVPEVSYFHFDSSSPPVWHVSSKALI
jgi:hypothetical protein